MTTSPAVTFDFNTWIATVPTFANCSPEQGQAWFNRASIICTNNTCNPAFADGNLPTLLYLLTSHIGWLEAPRDAQGNPAVTGSPASPIVGRVNSASEGSVSVGADMGDANAGSPSQAWYLQTKWGAEYWYATTKFREALYVPGPCRNFQPIYPFFPGRRW